MREYIEQKRIERLNANLAHGVSVGDFVQEDSWFDDIWAEVVSTCIFNDPKLLNHSNVAIIRYDKYGRARNKETVYLCDIRTILPAYQAEHRLGDIYHTINGKRGGGSIYASWPTQAGPHTPTNPGGRDRGKEWHPNVPADQRTLNYIPR